MYILLGVTLSMAIWAWWALSPMLFYGSLLISILVLTYVDMNNVLAKDSLFIKSIRIMKKTDCCLLHDLWSDPNSVRWIMIMFRLLSAMMAVAAIIVSWDQRKHFLDGHYVIIASVWSAVSIFWIISCLPVVICLLQCAANPTFRGDVAYNVDSSELILRFRKIYFLWTMHDLVLGIFWLYLAIMVYDLADDQDDSEWRTIFLSMLSWHIIIVIIYEMYMKPMWSSEPIQKRKRGSSACCAPENAKNIWSALTIIAYIGMYIIVLLRMQKPNLLEMGLSSVVHPVLFSLCQLAFVFGKYYKVTKKTTVRRLVEAPNSTDMLDF